MRILLFFLLLSPIFASAQILRAYGVIEIGGFPTSSATGPKFAYRPADSSFYRWVSGSTWVKIIPDEPDTLYLKQLSGTTALVDGDTIDISTYFLKSDTTSAFASYLKRPVGWGLSLLTGKYPFVDSSKVASRYYVSTSPTSIAANYIATSNGGNLVARNLFDNDVYVGILNGKPFKPPQWTTAGRPAGVLGYLGLNTNLTLEFYDGSSWTQLGLLNRTQEWTGMNTFTRTSEPLRIGYDASKYASFVIGAQGSLGITVNGTNPDITLTATNGGGINFIPGATGAINMYTTSAGFALRNTTGTPTFFGFYNTSAALRGLWGLTNSTNGLITGSVANDMAFRTQGGNLLFSTDSGNNSHMYIKSNGNVGIGIGQVNPQRTLHVTGEMRLTDLTTDPPTRIVGADADGDIGQITFGTGITAPSGVLTVPTWKGELEAGNNFTISASSKTTTLKGDGNVFRTTTSTGARGSLVQNGAVLVAKTTPGRFGGNFFIQDTTGVVDNLFYMGQDDDGSIQALGSGPQITHTLNNTKLPGQFRWAYAVRVDTSVAIPALRIVYGDRYASAIAPVSHRWYAGLQATATISAFEFTSQGASGKTAFNINSSFYVKQSGKINFASDSTFAFDPNTDLLQLSAYGTPATTAPSQSKTESGYVASFSTDGTVTSYKLARDTFIEDVTLFSVGTLMNACQELNIVSSMTVTAPTNMEIRFPDAADELRGKKIIVYSKKKDAGSFVPQIKVVGGASRLYFTTNPAIGGTDPSDQSTLSIDDSVWSDHGTTFEFTCLRIDNTPSYRWVLKQR